MRSYVSKILKIKSTAVLCSLSIFCILLSLIRILLAKNYFLIFLIWNLFLAFVPWFISSILYLSENCKKHVFFPFTLVWLLFFPNAPYIVTDIVHFKSLSITLRWFDLILLFSYSFTGLFYAFVSLDFMETKIKKITGIKYPQFFSAFVIYLSAFGIYLGRFLRWNSWDVVMNFTSVLKDLFLPIQKPFIHSKTWAFIFLLGTLFNLIHISYKNFKKD